MNALLLPLTVTALAAFSCSLGAADLPVTAVEPQPFFSALQRLVEAADFVGSPFSSEEKQQLNALVTRQDAEAVAAAQRLLDSRALFLVTINPEQRVKVGQGPAAPELVEAGWRQFLVKVVNGAGTTAALKVASPEGKPVFGAPFARVPVQPAPAVVPPLGARWIDVQMFNAPPLKPTLSGLGVEYRLLACYSRDAGKREAKFSFDVGQGTQDLGFRNETSVLFDCRPAREIPLRILDENGAPGIASLLIKDHAGRIHPSPMKRLAPDFGFQEQIYRADGETLKLPEGDYNITFQRGPESLPEQRRVKVAAQNEALGFQVRRWVDPAKRGWWSGDHHIHAAGCAHYASPTEGVHAPDMARHCQGEDLKIGANLTWGPCFDYQKQFFTGRDDAVSQHPFLLRYDLEISGFGSHRSGHLCLLKLEEQMYPGGDSTAHWPTLCLNTLKWGKRQGALCGPAHSGWGLQPVAPNDPRRSENVRPGLLRSATDELPNDIVPPFNGIGANEYIVDITHEVPGPGGAPVPAVDFLSMVDTPHTWELNIWYHTLNAGFRPRVSGETDFPCIYGERLGLGRSYVKVDGRLSYDAWCEGIRAGRCYVSDGRSHLMDFTANGLGVGERGSELRLAQPATVKLTAQVAALLDETPHPEIHDLPADQKPFWHLERARIGRSREVPVEVIVNGRSVLKQNVLADGATREMSFDAPMTESGWVALRIRASSHTNPVFIVVKEQPIRVRRSLEWCLKGVDQCWSQKESLIDPREREDAIAAYDQARQVYRTRIAECRAD